MTQCCEIIINYARLWFIRINRLKPIEYNNVMITRQCLDVFNEKNKTKNDYNNKKRENIIGCIINNKVPKEYYKISLRWFNFKKKVDSYIKKLCEKENISLIHDMVCIHKAGRSNKYDLLIIINNTYNFKVEFKFGASCVNETPQFVSPMKPSQYLSEDFESWYYDNYLFRIAEFGNLNMPSKEEYCKNIHNNKVICMNHFKEKYNKDINFNKYCKKIDKEAIEKFIKITTIDTTKLSKYLLESQMNKHYMCYNKHKIYYDSLNTSLYEVSNLIKREKTNYIYQNVFGMKLEIKLRFKNGCGLQFPAFQIKRKIPTIKELKLICQDNKNKINKVPKLKRDICIELNKHNIIY